jgi:bifunctional oligoribonuclease and PAP phosphatase NrnA
MSLKKVVEAIKRNHSFLVSAHVNLEGDALGSELALARLLRSEGKRVQVVNQDRAPLLYEFLPGAKTIRQPKGKIADFKVAIAVDCSDLNRIGTVKKLIAKDKLLVNIDHHISNDNFGRINWVNSKASSASEMIYDLYRKGKFKMDKEAALLLYTGMVVDTGSFRYSNTTAHAHLVAADLLRYGLPVEKVYNALYASLPLKEIKLLSRLLTGFRIDKSKRIIWLVLRRGMINEEKMRTDVSEYVFDFLRSIAGIEVAVIFREAEKNKIRVNFRSQGKANVAKIAAEFGGGGHACASGCTINTDLNSTQKMVIARIGKAL